MTLQEFIERERPTEVAKMIRVTRQIVYMWKNGKTVPSLGMAYRLVVASQYKLTLDSIYGPYLRKKYAGKKFKSTLRGREVQLEFKF